MTHDFMRRPRFWGAAFALITLVALAFALQNYTGVLFRSPELASWRYALVGTLPFWYSKLLLLPGVIVAARRWPLSGRIGRNALVHVPLSLLFSGLQLTLGMVIAWNILPPPGAAAFSVQLINLLATYFVTAMVFYWVLLALLHAVSYSQELETQRTTSRELVLRASELQTQLAEARLRALRSQLNPHFLFNALNAIAALCDKRDTRGATEMVGRLSDLLRLALNDHGHLTTLRRDLDFVDTYLKVEQVRFGTRLSVQRDLPEKTLSAAVPSLLLQPLVENAIRHGVSQMPGPGVVRISAALDDGNLVIRVEDSGPGFDQQTGRKGVGLQNTIARLDQLYGGAAFLSVEASDLGGAAICVSLPAANSDTDRSPTSCSLQAGARSGG